jgi:primosomal protein N' (replication factor Y) (superfamily II helicase)
MPDRERHGRLVSVAVPVPTLDLLTYRVPDGIELPPVGSRVLVPLGARRLTGVVAAAGAGASQAEPAGLKEIIDVLDAAAFLPSSVVGLGTWVGEYYACGPGEALGAAMPPFAWVESEWRVRITDAGRMRATRVGPAGRRTLREALLFTLEDGAWLPLRAIAYKLEHAGGGRRPRALPVRAAVRSLQAEGLVDVEEVLGGKADAFKTVRVAAITAQGLQWLSPAQGAGEPSATGLGRKQQEALTALAGVPEGLPIPQLRARGLSTDVVERLQARGLVGIRREQIERDPFDTSVPALPDSHAGGDSRVLTEEQAAAFAQLRALASQGFSTVLLHGVTGSGKTEIYLRLASVVRDGGKSVLVLVPEIGLTPALAGAFRGRFGERVAIQHSGLSDGERHDQWHRIRRGEVDVVVGTRSAVFTPLPSLGLIVVDEEHDGSYKQEESPRYHGRDVAVMRGKREGALVVLGSATPSLESFQNAAAGRYRLITLARRVLDRPLASVTLVNMRDEFAECGPDVVISRALMEGVSARLARREQVLVLLNRRGYATAVFCRQCGGTIDCPNCSVSLTVHARGDVMRARCHYCNYSATVPTACPTCAAPYLTQAGFGTERVEREVVAAFPDARVARLDRDTIRRRGAAATLLARFARREVDILVGTQMIAKGHDFPSVTLVGVVSADVGLGVADFRASERTFQLLTQVVGRAGRGTEPGEAIIQTLFPEHYSIRHARAQDYGAFFEDELNFRRAMLYPPHVALTSGIVRARSLAEAMADAGSVVRVLREAGRAGGFQVLGPAPAPFAKLRGEHRAQFFLKGSRRASMREAIRRALDGLPNVRRRIVIDVDPMSVL